MVSVPPVSDVIELVAHEMEHVLEWVDRCDLPGEARPFLFPRGHLPIVTTMVLVILAI